MNFTQLFCLILIVHFLADFALQTHEQATNKSSSNKWLFYHVGTYTLMWSVVWFVLPINSGALNPIGWLMFVLAIGLPHFGTDWLTSRIGKPFWKSGDMHNGFTVVGFDQVIHYMCLWFVLKEFIVII